ncbi:unnamed protein product [Toxocara canis]|uniref:KIF1B domain-containing protein n=1 Tax=Toxocara canis TaxID=6265 RepID=A0A183U213_TOXCA|nr:unnamed protein product [Toxocara canis]
MQIWIKVHDSVDDTYFMWEKNRFMNRYYGMQEMYQNFVEGDTDWDVPKERDPFYEPPDSEVLIGSSTVYLQSLAYLIEHEEQLPIFDFGGQDLGRLTVALTPCTPAGKEILGEYVEDPAELLVNYLKDRSLYTTIWGTQKIRKLSLRSAAPSAPKRRIGNANTDRDKVQRVERLLDETQKVSAQTISMRAVEKALNGVTHEEEHHQDQKPKKENVAKK